MVWRSGRAYSADLRERLLAAIDSGAPARVVAGLFRVSVSYVYKALTRRRVAGETAPRPQRGHRTPKLAALHEAIRGEVAGRPDVTLAELRAWLLEVHGTSASLGTMHNTLARLGLTLKKSRAGPRSRSGRTSPRRARPGVPDKPN